MAFDLPRQEHCVYKNTFLHVTRVEVGISSPSQNNDLGTRIKTYFNQFFGLNKTINELYSPEGIMLTSEDDESFVFTNSKISYTCTRKKYVSFIENILPYFAHIKVFAFHVLKLFKLEYLEEKKINVFPIEIYDDKSARKAKNVIYRSFFSDELLSIRSIPKDNLPDSMIDLNCVELTENNDTAIILYGLSKTNTPRVYNVVLDTTVRRSSSEGISEGDFDSNMLDVNASHFDIYHWAVSANVKKLMKK